MAPMQTDSASDPSNPYITVARRLGRSWSAQFLATLLVAAFFAGAVYFLWHHRDFAAYGAVWMVVSVGLRCLWRMLSVPHALQARWTQRKTRWAEENEVLKDSWARIFRLAYWAGPFGYANALWREGGFRLPNKNDVISTMIFGIIALLAHLRCRQIIREAQKPASAA